MRKLIICCNLNCDISCIVNIFIDWSHHINDISLLVSRYCIPASEEEKFHQVAETLASDLIDSDPLWLPEDTLALSPDTLREHGVSLCRIVQKPGQFLVVFPQTFTASVSGGYNISESLHFATADWIPLGCKAAQVRIEGHWISVRLWYLQCDSNGDTTVLH